MTFPIINGQTYADHIGKEYYFFQGIYIGTSFLAFIFSTIQCYRAWYNTKYVSHLLQRRTLVAITLMSIFFFIQSIDPLGYSNILPPIVEVITSSLSTYFGLSILFVLIDIFTGIFTKFENVEIFSFEKLFWKILFSLLTISTIVFPFLQVYVNRSVFRGTKLILFSILLSFAAGRTDYLIYKVYKVLKFREENTVRIKIHLIIFNVIMPFIIIIQFIFGVKTLSSSSRLPKITLEEYIFPICELFVIIFGTSFMSKIVEKKSYNASHDNASHDKAKKATDVIKGTGNKEKVSTINPIHTYGKPTVLASIPEAI